MKKLPIILLAILISHGLQAQNNKSQVIQDGIILQTKVDRNHLGALGGQSGKTLQGTKKKTLVSMSKDNNCIAVSILTKEIEIIETAKEFKHISKNWHHAQLFDLSRSTIVSKLDGHSYQFVGDQLIRYDYEREGLETEGSVLALYRDGISQVWTIDPHTLESKISLGVRSGTYQIKGWIGDKVLINRISHDRFTVNPTPQLYEFHEGAGLKLTNTTGLKPSVYLGPGNLSLDGKYLLTRKGANLLVSDIAKGEVVQKINTKGSPWSTAMTDSGDIYIGTQFTVSDTKERTLKANLNGGKSIGDLNVTGSLISISDDEKYLVSVSAITGEITLVDLATDQILSRTYESYFEPVIGSGPLRENVSEPFKINQGKHFLIAYANGIVSLFSVKERGVIANLYFDEEDWAVVAKDGRVDGTDGAFKKLEWQEYKGGQMVGRASLDASFNNFFTPGLLGLLLDDVRSDSKVTLAEMVNQTPGVSIISPSNGSSANDKEVSLTVQATAKGDPVSEILLYVNGKLSGGNERGFKVIGERKEFLVTLSPGRNSIVAKAVSKKGFESEPDEIVVTYNGVEAQSNLYVLGVGIDQYRNPTYNLNYALADASAFVNGIQNQSGSIFKSVEINMIENSEASKENLLAALQTITQQASPEDVFVFYYAGHGVMSEGSDLYSPDFYLALHGVTQLYGQEDMLREKGVSALELRNAFSQINAQKQLIVLDACQSGGAVETFARRGSVQEKAMIQLARSAGLVLLASTGSEQFATEFDELGHGVFTYALLQGMSGKADGGSNDGKITVKELESYMNDAVPELTEKYKGTVQFPQSWARGQDFPLVIVKQ